MNDFFQRIKDLHRLPSSSKTPANTFFIGAYWGLFALSMFIMAFAGFYFRTGISSILQVFVYLLLGGLAFYVFRWLASSATVIARYFPTKYLVLILSVVGIFWLAKELRLSWPDSQVPLTLACLITGGIFCGGAVSILIQGVGKKSFGFASMILGLLAILLPIYPIFSAGTDPYPFDFKPFTSENLIEKGIENPGVSGDYEVEFFTYGSGKNARRPEFGEEAQYITPTVDARLLLPEWKGKRKKWRERFWGFGLEEAPINGRVWMPKKDGPSPLILIVHGNHGMEHFSDPGYEYLGELLANRGFITVSVDENYINGTWSGDFRGREMPARAWLLLKHLEQWRNWNDDPKAELFNKADLGQVLLMGHSRGGEAVSIAAAYNRLDHFPDDARVKFDFNFGIKGIVTIAPTDQRYFRRIELDDLNYLSLQGSYDADEASFFGLRQYQRVAPDPTKDQFKAGVLIHKANHGQFNSIWGRRDFGEPYGWFLNTGPLITGEEQREIAKIYIGAFAERVLNDRSDYDPLFQNYASAEAWFPETVIVNNYNHSRDHFLVSFEEDIDLTTSPIGPIEAKNFLVWREEALKMRGGETQGTDAVILGWDNDSIQQVAQYTIQLDSTISIPPHSSFIFNIGRANDMNFKVADSSDVNFSIELVTAENDTLSADLSAYKKIAPKLRIKYMKLSDLNGSFGPNWEVAMESVAIPLKDMLEEEIKLKAIAFKFNRSPKGLIALDQIGFRLSNESELK